MEYGWPSAAYGNAMIAAWSFSSGAWGSHLSEAVPGKADVLVRDIGILLFVFLVGLSQKCRFPLLKRAIKISSLGERK